jgi:hypothetical protein
VFAERLRAARGERGQREIAVAIGVTQPAFSAWEKPVGSFPGRDLWAPLAKEVGKTVEELFFETDEQQAAG